MSYFFPFCHIIYPLILMLTVVFVCQEELSDMGDVRHLVNKLYMALNVDQHQVMKERDILAQIEDLKSQLAPLEKVQLTEIFAYTYFGGHFLNPAFPF